VAFKKKKENINDCADQVCNMYEDKNRGTPLPAGIAVERLVNQWWFLAQP
jgi:hypothetical protein